MKQGFQYIRAQIPTLLSWALLSFCFTFIAILSHMQPDLIVFCLCLIAVAFAIPLLVAYWKTRSFYQRLHEISKSEEPFAALQSFTTRRPGLGNHQSNAFQTGTCCAASYPEHIVCSALVEIQKNATALISASAKDTREYRDYIELWSHEIKTPLAAATLLASLEAPEKNHAILEELQRIDSYVEQALFLARSYAVNQDFSVSTYSMEKLVKKAVASRKNILIAQNANITIAVKPSNLEVLCDEKWIVFALGQIIDNACKYSLDGNLSLTFSAHICDQKTSQERVVLSIKDLGRGIPSYDISRVLEKGYVGRNGRKEQSDHSTGMGLYLVAKIARRMGLSIELKSQSVLEYPDSFTQIDIVFPQNRFRHLPY